MDYLTFMLLISFVIASIHFFISIVSSKISKSSKHPPGPHPFPIIGNILELGTQPHHVLTKLSKTYGPIMTLKLGNITTIVISSPQIAREVLQKNDHAFSYRSVPDSVRALDHYKHSVAWNPPSAQWRLLRRVCAAKFFSPQKLDSTKTLRQRKVQELLDHLGEICRKGEASDIGEAFLLQYLTLYRTLFSPWIWLIITLIRFKSLRTLYGA